MIMGRYGLNIRVDTDYTRLGPLIYEIEEEEEFCEVFPISPDFSIK